MLQLVGVHFKWKQTLGEPNITTKIHNGKGWKGHYFQLYEVEKQAKS